MLAIGRRISHNAQIMHSRGKPAMRILILGFGIVSAALAQTGSGAIQGTVTDISGAAVTAAKVRVEHVETAQVHDGTTNQVGYFQFPAMQPGRYKVVVNAPGMQDWAGEMTLQVG